MTTFELATKAASGPNSKQMKLLTETGSFRLSEELVAAWRRSQARANRESIQIALWAAEVSGVADIIRNSKSIKSLDYAPLEPRR